MTAEEVRATRAGAGLFDRTGTAVVEIAGPDAADYLHRMLTSSVKTLQPGQGAKATVLKGDGRMIAPVTVHRTGAERFLLLAPAVCRDSLVAHIDRYLITEDAAITDRTDEQAVLAVTGPKAAEAVGGVLEGLSGDLEVFSTATAPFGGGEVLVIRSDFFRLPGFLLLVSRSAEKPLRDAIAARVAAAGGCSAGAAAWEILRVEAGEPEFGTDMDESTIPLEANLRDAIDFRKGCFPGQEIVARIENLGHPAKMLVGLKLPPDVASEPGTPLYFGEKETGRITSVAQSPTLGVRIALGTVRWDQREPGTGLTVGTPGFGIQAVVTPLPFVG